MDSQPVSQDDPKQIGVIADEVLAALDDRRQIQSISARVPRFDIQNAYKVAAAVRERRRGRGELPIGRKLGFTNRNIWDEYGVYAPIWGYVYDSTVRDVDPHGARFDMSTVVEPRIEPEITLAFKKAPDPEMDEPAILECIDWVAHGFEVVQSLFPGWKFSAPDTIAAFGLHGALLLGPRIAVSNENRDLWQQYLSTFRVALSRNGECVDRGSASNVLGGPLSALRNAIRVLAEDAHNPPIAAGEIVTTGTVTRAFPMQRHESWRTRFDGAPFAGLTLVLD